MNTPSAYVAVQESEKFCYSLYHMKNPDKPSDFVHIRNILDDVLKPYRSKPDFELKEVWRLWDEAVGETIAQNAQINHPSRATMVPKKSPFIPIVPIVPIPAATLEIMTIPMACPMAPLSASTSS